MTRSQLTGIIAEIIIDTIREKKGRLTEISDLCVINRQEFDVDGLAKMKFGRIVRLSQAVAQALPRKRCEEMLQEIAKKFWESIDEMEDAPDGKN